MIDVTPSLSGAVDGSATQEFARVPITVSGQDIAGLAITTMKGVSVTGQFVFNTGEEAANLRPGNLALRPQLDPQLGLGRSSVNSDWTFEIANVFGAGVLRLSTTSSTANSLGWYLKTVLLDGKDVTDTPIEFRSDRSLGPFQIVLTQKRTTVTGVAVDAKSGPSTDFVTVVFAEDRQRWTPRTRFIAAGRSDQQGRFTIRDLPPGRYLAAAVDYLETGEETDAGLLTRLADRATHVELGEGASQTVNLTVISR
jgi:hypothetical protein